MAGHDSEDVEKTVGEMLEDVDVITTLLSDSCDKIKTTTKWVLEEIVTTVVGQKNNYSQPPILTTEGRWLISSILSLTVWHQSCPSRMYSQSNHPKKETLYSNTRGRK